MPKDTVVLVDHTNVQGEDGYNKKIPHQQHYLKEDVASTAQFQDRGQRADVIISLSHGWFAKPRGQTPMAGLCFRCEGRGNVTLETMVYAKDYPSIQHSVTLHSIINGCRLAIILCCHGSDVLEHYLEHVREMQPLDSYHYITFPNILISCGETINTNSTEIYMVLLTNIVESIFCDDNDLPQHMYDAITRIMQIVKLFGDDHVSFWLFLEHVGCVTDTAEEKNRQELEHPPAHGEAPSFRIYGRVCPIGYHTLPREILQDFKNIRLVCPVTQQDSVRSNYGPDPRVRQITWETVDDFKYEEKSNRKIDNFLRKYQLLTKNPETPVASPPESDETPGDVKPFHDQEFSTDGESGDEESSSERGYFDSSGHMDEEAHLSPMSLLLARLHTLQF
jgi:hypothetical protein